MNEPMARETADSIAAALAEAHKSAAAIPPVRKVIGDDLTGAYRIQEQLIRMLQGPDERRSGRKIGLTSPAVQEQLGVDQPDYGMLLETMEISSGGTIDVSKLVAPRVEAEVAFVLSREITDASAETVYEAVDYAVGALEIVDSRIENWDISIVDTVADNASSAGFVLGDSRLSLDDFEPRNAEMELIVNGEVVSTGNGQACLGDPLNALVWVAKTALACGDPLQAGEVILSGALGPMVPLRAGDSVTANIGPLGSVSVYAGGKE